MEAPEGDTSFFETKFMTADGFLFDVSVHPWLGAEPLEGSQPG